MISFVHYRLELWSLIMDCTVSDLGAKMVCFSGLYYKPSRIINNKASVVNRYATNYNASSINYYYSVFIMQATGWVIIKLILALLFKNKSS